MISKILIFIFGICGNPIVWAQSGVSGVITLQQALNIAFENSPDYKTSKNLLEAAEAESQNAFARFLPTIDLTATHGVQGFDPDTNNLTARTPWVSETSFILTENFYDNGQSINKKRIADSKLRLIRTLHHKTKAIVIRDVVLAYYRYGISEKNFGFVTRYSDELERLSKLVSNQYYQGLKTKKDFLSFKSREQRSKLDVIDAEKKLISSKAKLISMLGLNPEADYSFDSNIKPLLPKKKLDPHFADDELYETRELEIQKEISEAEVSLVKREYWPELSLVGTASYGSSDYVDTRQTWSDSDGTQWSLFLNFKFNILDWGVRSRNVTIAKLTQNNLELAKKNALLTVRQEVEVFKIEAKRSAENYRLSKELQNMEEDTFKLLERDYKSGLTSYLELTTGLANLLDAQSRGLEADYNQADLYLRWKYYKGILDENTVFE